MSGLAGNINQTGEREIEQSIQIQIGSISFLTIIKANTRPLTIKILILSEGDETILKKTNTNGPLLLLVQGFLPSL